jgi:hypothetical protein
MTQRFFLGSIIVSSSLVAAMMGACGGDSSTGDAGPDSTTNDSAANDAGNESSANDAGSDTGNDSSPPSEAGSDAGGCDGGCYVCCAAEDPMAAQKLFEGAVACGCTTPGDCKMACAASLCATTPKKPDKACIDCLLSADAGSCGESAAMSCADAGCGPVAACMEACAP